MPLLLRSYYPCNVYHPQCKFKLLINFVNLNICVTDLADKYLMFLLAQAFPYYPSLFCKICYIWANDHDFTSHWEKLITWCAQVLTHKYLDVKVILWLGILHPSLYFIRRWYAWKNVLSRIAAWPDLQFSRVSSTIFLIWTRADLFPMQDHAQNIHTIPLYCSIHQVTHETGLELVLWRSDPPHTFVVNSDASNDAAFWSHS